VNLHNLLCFFLLAFSYFPSPPPKLQCPALIFLDEPTSGLDSVMAESMVMTCSDLARNGRIVISSIHGPNAEMMRNFTQVVLLTHDGHLAFHGPSKDAVKHLVEIG